MKGAKRIIRQKKKKSQSQKRITLRIDCLISLPKNLSHDLLQFSTSYCIATSLAFFLIEKINKLPVGNISVI